MFKPGDVPWNKGKTHLSGEKHNMYGKKHTLKHTKTEAEYRLTIGDAKWQMQI